MKAMGRSWNVCWALLLLQVQLSQALGATIKTDQNFGSISISSWHHLRFAEIVQQSLDDSCGAASLATILTFYFGENVTEADLIEKMDDDGRTSFLEMNKIAREYGIRAVGVRLPFSELKKLRMPAIAYVSYRGNDHFTVVRGVDFTGNVLLADSMWGNRKFTAGQFRDMWETSSKQGVKLGKLLLIRSKSPSAFEKGYFSNNVKFRNLMRNGQFNTRALD